MHRIHPSMTRCFFRACRVVPVCAAALALVSCGADKGASGSDQPRGEQGAAGKEKRYKDQALFERLNGGAELVLEYGVDELRETSTPAAGGGEVVAGVWTMRSPAGAYGLYASRKGDTPRPPAGVGDVGMNLEGLEVRFVKGATYCEVVYQGADTASGRREVARQVKRLDASIATGSGLPPEIGALPKKHRMAWTEQLALGPLAMADLDGDNVLGVSRNSPLGMAQYRANDAGGYFTLGLMRLGSAAEARERLESAAKALGGAGYAQGPSPVSDARWLESKDFGGWLLAVRGSFLAACMNVRDSSRLTDIVDQISP